jgi:hypothetical protein
MIQQLTEAADGLEEPEKTFKLSEINRFKFRLEGQVLDELRQKIEKIQLKDLKEIDTQIAAAKNATAIHQFRFDAFNVAFGLLKKALGILHPRSAISL